MAEKTEDLNLPIAAVTRIIKDVLPDGVTISKEARVAIARAASVFVLYATSTANGFAQKSKRKTLTANDVVEAMKDLEFDEFVEPLQRALQSFKDAKSKKSAPSSKTKNLASLREEDIILDDDDDEEGEEVAKDATAPTDSSDLAVDRTSSPVSMHSSDSSDS